MKKSENSNDKLNLSKLSMVEDFLKEHSDLPMKISKLKEKLPKQLMYKELHNILDYLEMSGKIMIGTKGILWIYSESEQLKKMIKEGLEI